TSSFSSSNSAFAISLCSPATSARNASLPGPGRAWLNMNMCWVWFKSHGRWRGVPQPRYMKAGSSRDPAVLAFASTIAIRRDMRRISGLPDRAADSNSARLIGGEELRACWCSCFSRLAIPSRGSELEESAAFASTDISKLDKRIRTLTVFINSSTTRQTFRRNPVGHALALRSRRSLTLDKALGRDSGSGLDSQNGNRRELRVRWWRMQVDSQQCSRCHGE